MAALTCSDWPRMIGSALEVDLPVRQDRFKTENKVIVGCENDHGKEKYDTVDPQIPVAKIESRGKGSTSVDGPHDIGQQYAVDEESREFEIYSEPGNPEHEHE